MTLLSFDLDLLMAPISGADRSSRFLFCPEDENEVLLVGMGPRAGLWSAEEL